MAIASKARILCIEDDVSLADMYQHMLEDAGYEAVLAHSFQAGLAALEANSFDLILLDYQLPDERNGLDFLKALQPLPDPPPVVVITAAGSEQVAVESVRLGALDYLVKDFRGRFLKNLPYVVGRALQRGQLSRQIQRLESDLIESRRQDSLATLAAGIAHHLNNLLTTIIGCATLTRMGIDPGSEAYQNLLKIEQAANEAAELGTQMQVFSGQARPEVQMLDLATLLRELGPVFGGLLLENVSLDIKIPDLKMSVRGDADQIRQAVLDVFLNASEAIGEGRGQITLEVAEELQPTLQHGEICSNPLPPVPCFVLSINDTGCGIFPDALEHIFDPFFTTKAPGRGLGLAGVLGIVRGHKGAVAAKSELEQGTRLRLFFPQATAVVPARPISMEPELTAPVGSAFILVVDDEASVLHTTKAILEMQGFSVLTAASGEEGMEIFEEHARDIALALVDLAMPGMDGKQMMEALYARQASLPVIIMSGFPVTEALRGFTSRRPALFLQKPYSAHVLIESVIKALRSRK